MCALTYLKEIHNKSHIMVKRRRKTRFCKSVLD